MTIKTKKWRRRWFGVTAIATGICMAIWVAGCSMMGTPANDGISDAEITSGVEAKLAAESTLDEYTIGVKTDDGVVHLSGNVATGGERDTAEKVARGARGVVRVDNYIQFGAQAPVISQ